eukprot:Skav214488  [mRNA]  locus=scaffold1011:72018:73691:- [translate_table: standard]
MLIRREVVEYTPLWNYAFHLRQGRVMSVLLGAASMLNHGSTEMVNVRFSRESESIIQIVADRDVQEGEELFTSYGSEDWFLDRHIAYQEPTEALTNLGSAHFTGDCLETIAPDNSSEAIVAKRSLNAGDIIQSPVFLIPRWLASQATEVMSHSFSHPAWDVVVLPFLLPGSLAKQDLETFPNVVYSVSMEAEVAKHQIHHAVSIYQSSGTLRIKALRDILPGEKLMARAEIVETQKDGTKNCEFHNDLPTSSHDFPGSWKSVNFWQSQVSAAEAGDSESQFKVAEAFRLGLHGQLKVDIDALSWYRRAGQQGHLEATFRAGATIHDMLQDGKAERSERSAEESFGSKISEEMGDWYSKAAARGHIRAQLLLAEIFSDGKFLPQNLTKATFWGRKALASGASRRVNAFSETFYEIAMALSSEELQSKESPFFWLQVAADAGSPDAQYFLGKGLGDGSEALDLLHRAATQGHTEAAFELAMALGGQNVSSISWFRVAANKGHAAAQYNLGVALKNSGAVDEADYWFKKAAANGLEEKRGIQRLQDGISYIATTLRSLFS